MILRVNDIAYSLTLHQENPELPYLLMLHGFMGSSEVFEHLVPELNGFCNPITMDLLGHGNTEIPDLEGRYVCQCQVKDMDDIIRNLGRSPIFLYGYSMGGRLALQYATLHPERLTGLILESTNPGLIDPDERAVRVREDEQRASAIESDFSAFLEQWWRLPLFKNGIDLPQVRVRKYRDVQQTQEPRAMAACLREFGTGQMPAAWKRLERLEMDVLLLAGEADHKYCTVCGDMSKLLPNSRYHRIEDAGHRIHQENPDALADRIRSFITKWSAGTV